MAGFFAEYWGGDDFYVDRYGWWADWMFVGWKWEKIVSGVWLK